MAKISRKELKQDEITLEVTKGVEFVQSHREPMILAGVVAGIVLLIGVAGYLIYDKRVSNANEALGTAMLTFHAPVHAPSPVPDQSKYFITDKEKYLAALKEFLPVAQKYSWLKPGRIARYYVGLCQANLDNLPEAEKELNASLRSDDDVAALSRMALANALVRAGRAADGEKLYRELIDHPANTVPKTTAQLALAAQIRDTKPAEAEKIYRELQAAKINPTVTDQAQQGLASMNKK